ncbi:hypothetical protein LXL04_033516 [Taraxacum kok-saghyz]
MAESEIRRVSGCDEEDRISNLPEHLIDSILEPLPVEDAINLPELKKLKLVACTNVNNFNFTATKLKYLLVFGCPDAMLLRLLNSPCLTEVGMYLQNPIEDNIRVERMTLVTMLSKLPKIEVLTLYGLFFKAVIAEKIPKWLPHAVNSLKYLWLFEFEVGDLDQLEGVLCLIRNSPNLETLTVNSLKMEFQVIDRYDVGPAADHLESPNCLDCTLNQLELVEITDLNGSRPELLFIELLLAHSPSLNKFTIRPSGASDLQKRFDILKDVIQFPRASPKARILFLDPKT